MRKHLLKNFFATAAHGHAVQEALEKEVRLELTKDGITDVAFVLEGPRNSA